MTGILVETTGIPDESRKRLVVSTRHLIGTTSRFLNSTGIPVVSTRIPVVSTGNFSQCNQGFRCHKDYVDSTETHR